MATPPKLILKTPAQTLRNNFGRRQICGHSGPVRQDWHAIIEAFHGRAVPPPRPWPAPPENVSAAEWAEVTASADHDARSEQADPPGESRLSAPVCSRCKGAEVIRPKDDDGISYCFECPECKGKGTAPADVADYLGTVPVEPTKEAP